MNTGSRTILIVLGVLVLVVVIIPLVGGGMMGPGSMMWGFGPQGGPPGAGGWAWGLAMGLGWLTMLAFWGALIAGVVLLIRWLSGTTAGSAGPGRESALDILKRRYAAGEITLEEYERMRRDLER